MPETLKRKVGVGGAVMMGLGSIVGTGVFVSIGIGYSVAGVLVLPAILVATLVAALNGLSSAQLAANHPVSGGTYAYGYRWLSPVFGFSAGVLFLIAKSASAASAALGCAIYLIEMTGMDSGIFRTLTATLIVVGLTVLVAGGLKRSNALNIAIVAVTLIALALLIAVGLAASFQGESLKDSMNRGEQNLPVFLECCALMFVAFTGYGRIATLGEEIVEPARNIPRAIIFTLVISGLLYTAIGLIVVGTEHLRTDVHEGELLTLKAVADSLHLEWLQTVVSVGAVTAMLGVLLNLILGLSRVWLGMGRNGDAPAILGRIHQRMDSPTPAVVLTGLVVAGLTLVGDVKLAWSFSAFTVLIYYALTNLAATRLTREERYYPASLSWLGFFGCLSLAFFIDRSVIMLGASVLALAILGRWFFRKTPA